MKKQEILEIINEAIIEASPEAAELFKKNVANKNKDIFFVDLGINSIEYAEIAYIVMNKLNVDHPLDIFVHTNCVNDVLDICYDLAQIKT
jgi:acyl carrier protein